MRNKSSWAVLVAGTVLAMPAFAGCGLPAPPSSIPDGSSASEQEMIAAMNVLKQFDGDVNAFLKCLDSEARLNHISESDHERQQSDAVSTLHAVAAKFNEQVRLFKSKHS